MARVEKRKEEKSRHKRTTKYGLSLELPRSRSVPAESLELYTILVYGARKIGKTTLASYFEKAIHLMFEPGSRALRIYEAQCPDWEHAREWVRLLEKQNTQEKLKFKTVIIDTGAIAYDKCFSYVCSLKGCVHPNDMNDYGATWRAIRQEFENFHKRLEAMGMGLVILCHEKVVEYKDDDGLTFEVIQPELTGAVDEYYTGMVDNVFRYTYNKQRRVLDIRGSQFVVAGTRCQENFITTTGEKIWSIPMGESAEQAYSNLVTAFRNEQEHSNKPLTEKKTTKKYKKSRSNSSS